MTQDQLLPILLTGGIETKVDSKSVNLGKLLTLENGEFEKPGRIQKRTGFDSLGKSIVGGGSLSAATTLASDQNTNSLITLSDGRVYSYSPLRGGFVDIGPGYAVTAKAEVVLDSYNLFANNATDMVNVGNYEVYAFVDGDIPTQFPSPQFFIRDTSTGSTTYTSALTNSAVPPSLAAPNAATKITTDGTYAYHLAVWMRTGIGPYQQITVSKVDPTSSTPIVATLNINNSTVLQLDNCQYELKYTPAGLLLIYPINATTLRIRLYSTSLTLLYSVDTTVTTPGVKCVTAAYESSNQNIFVFTGAASSSRQVRYEVYDSTLTPVLAPTVINAVGMPWNDSTNSWYFVQLAAIQTGTNEVTLLAAASPPFASNVTQQGKIAKYTVTSTGVTLTDDNFCITGNLCSSIQTRNGKYYVLTGYYDYSYTPNDLQSVFYLNEVTTTGLKDIGTLGNAARILDGTAYADIDRNGTGFQTFRGLPNLNLRSDGTLKAAVRTRSSLGFKSGVDLLSISSATFNFDDIRHNQSPLMPDNTFFFVAGQPITISSYSSEYGFNQIPIIAPTPVVGSGSLSPNSTYQYAAVYEWVDASGQIHQSAPSTYYTVNTNASQNTVNIGVQLPLRSTKRDPVRIVIYRTAANGATFYRITESMIYFLQAEVAEVYATSGSYATYVDLAMDSAITSNQILYTTGGILPNDPAPNSTFQWLYKNRTMLGGLDDGNAVMYSKTRVAGEPVKFNALLFTNVDIAGGDVTAGGTLDDKCIFFKKNKIFYMYGDGPNDAGGGQAFSIPQEISSPVGCAYPKSVVAMPLGLMFKSEKGIFLLDRGLNSKYIGSPVEAYNSANITSAIHMAERNQVRFTLDTGVALVYDYLVDQWSVFTNINAVGSTLYQNKHTFIQPTGTVFQQGTSFLDNTSTPITLTIGLPWIKLQGLQGFQRIKELMLIGEYKSPHTLTVQIGYNYDSAYADFFSWTPANVLGIDGESTLDQFRIFPRTQKCEAMRILISDNGTSTTGEGYNLSELQATIGLKKGHYKVSAARTGA